ncbi:MAG: hypothetical protein IJE45_00235 [Bacilli bacterium]|nr:hypothetical protein [Bacilli bacterium]
MVEKQLENELLELNEQFSEFLKTKGIIVKFKLVVENIKKANSYGKPNNTIEITADILAEEFNNFLKEKGLNEKYSVVIIEE